jgi:hypothetical protein
MNRARLPEGELRRSGRWLLRLRWIFGAVMLLLMAVVAAAWFGSYHRNLRRTSTVNNYTCSIAIDRGCTVIDAFRDESEDTFHAHYAIPMWQIEATLLAVAAGAAVLIHYSAQAKARRGFPVAAWRRQSNSAPVHYPAHGTGCPRRT